MRNLFALLAAAAALVAATVGSSPAAADIQSGNCVTSKYATMNDSFIDTEYSGNLAISGGSGSAAAHWVEFDVTRGSSYVRVKFYHNAADSSAIGIIETSSGNSSTISTSLGTAVTFDIFKDSGGLYDVTLANGSNLVQKNDVNLGGAATAAWAQANVAAKSPCIASTDGVSLFVGYGYLDGGWSTNATPFYTVTTSAQGVAMDLA